VGDYCKITHILKVEREHIEIKKERTCINGTLWSTDLPLGVWHSASWWPENRRKHPTEYVFKMICNSGDYCNKAHPTQLTWPNDRIFCLETEGFEHREMSRICRGSFCFRNGRGKSGCGTGSPPYTAAAKGLFCERSVGNERSFERGRDGEHCYCQTDFCNYLEAPPFSTTLPSLLCKTNDPEFDCRGHYCVLETAVFNQQLVTGPSFVVAREHSHRYCVNVTAPLDVLGCQAEREGEGWKYNCVCGKGNECNVDIPTATAG